MTNGFYNLKHLDTKEKLIEFYTRAIALSYAFHIDHLPEMAREMDKSMTLKEMLNLVSTATHNVCIDRVIYNKYNYTDEEIDNVGEVGFCTISGKSLYLFIYMNRKSLETLIKEFDLKLIEH